MLGCGISNSALEAKSTSGIWDAAIVWGISVYIAIILTESDSGAHLNPAVSLSFYLFRSQNCGYPGIFTFKIMLLYIASQLCGAVVGAAVTYLAWGKSIKKFERENNITRGNSGSELSASTLCGYFPSPSSSLYTPNDVSPEFAFFLEFLQTTTLVFIIFKLSKIKGYPTPILIGTTVSVLVAVYAPLTGSIMNPARDLGPRIVAYFAGWDSIAFPGPRCGFWVYIVGPCLGAIVGGYLGDHVFVSYKKYEIENFAPVK